MKFPKPKTIEQQKSLDYNASVNSAIGERFRQVRAELALTQGDVADFFGVSYQQVQKYEDGSNRLNAARLFTFLQSYNVSFSYFFESIDIGGTPTKNATTMDLKLYDKIRKIRDPGIKQAVVDFIYTLARAEK